MNLPEAQQVAILLMSLAPEVSALLFKSLTPEEVEQTVLEISRLPSINRQVRDEVIHSFAVRYQLTEDLEQEARLHPERVADGLAEMLKDSPPTPVAKRKQRRVDVDLVLEYPSGRAGDRLTVLLRQWVLNLDFAWGVQLPPVTLRRMEGTQVRVLWQGREVIARDVPTDSILVTPLRYTVQVLAWGLRVVASTSPPAGDPRTIRLSAEECAALGMLRSHHISIMPHELEKLGLPEFTRTARGFLHLLRLNEVSLEEQLKIASQFGPDELLQQAGLSNSKKDLHRARKGAALLRMLPSGERVLEELFGILPQPLQVQIATRLARTLIHHSDSPADCRRERLEVLGEFCEWRSRANRASVPSQDALTGIPVVWPWPNFSAYEKAFAQLSHLEPRQLAWQLSCFLQEAGAERWLPGPLRATHFLNTVENGEEVRESLAERGYPLPQFPLDLRLSAQARADWNQQTRLRVGVD